jgi:hypothetical protein
VSPDPPESPARWGPLDPVELGVGCALGCRTEIEVGPVPVPFGVGPDRGARSRMDDAEHALVSQGLRIDGVGPGLGARFEPVDHLSLDAAIVGDNLDRLAVRGPRPPDLSARLGYELGPFELGGSAWFGGFDDHAFAVDLTALAGWWTVTVEGLHESIGDVQRAFDEPPDAKRVVGDGLSLRLGRAFGPDWSVEVGGESRVFLSRRGLAIPAWARGVADLRLDPTGPARWTVVELAWTESIGGLRDLRATTQVDLTRRRASPR